jgi:hypothetical protein
MLLVLNRDSKYGFEQLIFKVSFLLIGKPSIIMAVTESVNITFHVIVLSSAVGTQDAIGSNLGFLIWVCKTKL